MLNPILIIQFNNHLFNYYQNITGWLNYYCYYIIIINVYKKKVVKAFFSLEKENIYGDSFVRKLEWW